MLLELARFFMKKFIISIQELTNSIKSFLQVHLTELKNIVFCPIYFHCGNFPFLITMLNKLSVIIDTTALFYIVVFLIVWIYLARKAILKSVYLLFIELTGFYHFVWRSKFPQICVCYVIFIFLVYFFFDK
jgi:hypothetical protein